MESSQRRRRVEPTDEWEQIELLCGWPEQRDYELIRPMVLFGAPADGRSQETGESSGRTLRRKATRFEAEGMESLFGSETARRRKLPPAMRRLIVDLKAEHPCLNPNEISPNGTSIIQHMAGSERGPQPPQPAGWGVLLLRF